MSMSPRALHELHVIEEEYARNRAAWLHRHFPQESPTMRELAELACGTTGFTLADLRSPSRSPDLCRVRFKAMHEIYQVRRADGERRWSMPDIGRFFHRDHTSVFNAIRRHEQTIKGRDL